MHRRHARLVAGRARLDAFVEAVIVAVTVMLVRVHG